MSMYGIAKGNEFEPIAKKIAQAEANGVMMYYALAHLAREQGFDEAADDFIEAAQQEANHAGFYAVAAGKYPQDFWGIVRGLKKAESNADKMLLPLAEQFRAKGYGEAADEIERFTKEELHHGELMDKILKKYAPAEESHEGQTVYVCPVCGYEHVGSMADEADDYICPICGQPKSAFQKK